MPTATPRKAMACRSLDPEKLATEIARLRDLDLVALKQRWADLFLCPTPNTLRRDLLIRSMAYRMQIEAFGELSPRTERKLRQVAEAKQGGDKIFMTSSPRIKPGTKLIRVWQDKTHTVTVLHEGFEWRGSRYRSLSEVARSITGTRWNGLIFFGVKPRPSSNKNALKRQEVVNA
jgi:hypothetical protein